MGRKEPPPPHSSHGLEFVPGPTDLLQKVRALFVDSSATASRIQDAPQKWPGILNRRITKLEEYEKDLSEKLEVYWKLSLTVAAKDEDDENFERYRMDMDEASRLATGMKKRLTKLEDCSKDKIIESESGISDDIREAYNKTFNPVVALLKVLDDRIEGQGKDNKQDEAKK